MPGAYLCGAAFGGCAEHGGKGRQQHRVGPFRVYLSGCLFGCLNSSRDAPGRFWELGVLGSAQTPKFKVKVSVPLR